MNNRSLTIYLFHCSNCLDTEALRHSFGDREKDNTLKTISLPCSGKLELIYLLKAFESGADGVMLVTCREGECRHLEGNLRALKRTGAIQELLNEMGLDKERMILIQQEDGGVKNVIDELDRFTVKRRNTET